MKLNCVDIWCIACAKDLQKPDWREMVLRKLRTMSKAPTTYVAAAVLAALTTLCIAQESVSISSVNGASEGSTQISSELWTVSPSAAQCPVGTFFPAKGISGVAVRVKRRVLAFIACHRHCPHVHLMSCPSNCWILLRGLNDITTAHCLEQQPYNTSGQDLGSSSKQCNERLTGHR